MSTPNAQLQVIKLILIGNSGVGKSCLLKSFMGDPFKTAYTSTIGVDFEIKQIKLPSGDECNLQIWDTAGQERFRTITTSYYRSADGILLVFDLTDLNSFIDLNNWLIDISKYASSNVDIICVGNKCDLETKRQVEYNTGKSFAESNKITYIEASAKQRLNVENAFLPLAQKIYERKLLQSNENQRALNSSTVTLNENQLTQSNGCIC